MAANYAFRADVTVHTVLGEDVISFDWLEMKTLPTETQIGLLHANCCTTICICGEPNPVDCLPTRFSADYCALGTRQNFSVMNACLHWRFQWPFSYSYYSVQIKGCSNTGRPVSCFSNFKSLRVVYTAFWLHTIDYESEMYLSPYSSVDILFRPVRGIQIPFHQNDSILLRYDIGRKLK